ncbi:hypothetical protein HX004_05735 [Myroides sp. 1354]|uniref:hypothetical protein n=1 Tax=unclassified Myroides TaxID=2642485 RepID=UPI002574C01A|nr:MULTISPECIES: hypothetical protein [unclassified Myroides]MDM1044563.1 hypothetical protein [Myroides sp. R163-1]MDM1055276.1 hypothetical protein [Myroides sp. 1354]MDM1068573.1 hypothetical protein [Myroides sp. 1372]
MKYTIGILLIGLWACQGLSAQEMNRTFPYHASLTGTSAPNNIVEQIKSGAPTGSNRYTRDGLQLTYDNTKKALSGFYLKDLEVPMNYAIEVDFEFATLDGKEYYGHYGDGISLFLFDANASFDLGSYGSGLGYAYNSSTGSRQAGLNGAYLGVSLDVYGDSRERMNSVNNKREGISGITFQREDSHITIRGGQHQNDRYKGYPVIYTQQTNWGNQSNANAATAKLDFNTGEYEEDSYAPSLPHLRTEYANTLRFYRFNFVYNPIHSEYDERGTMLQFYLRNDSGVIHGGNSEALFLQTEFRTKDENGSLYTFKGKNIDSYKIGIAGTTGDATETHLVKNVNVRLTHAPETKDKKVLLCLTDGGDDRTRWAKLEKPFDGSTFYVGDPGDPGRPKSGNTYNHIDFESVRLEDKYGYPLNYRTEEHTTTWSQIYDEPGVGEWDLTYNEFSATLYFTPANRIMEEGDYDVYISAKSVEKNDGSPFAYEDYRSRPTKITVQARHCKSVVNPSMPIRVVEEED